MGRRLRIGLLAVALIAATGLLVAKIWRDSSLAAIGMVEEPCTPDGKSITGRNIDDWAWRCLYRAANARLLSSRTHPEVVMIGDSLTADWPYQDQAIVGRGIGGQTSAQILVRFHQDAVALKPEIVHILAGTNDTAGNTGPSSPDMYIANIKAMVDMARANDIEVVLGTIPPAAKFPWRPRVDPQDWAQRLSRDLRALALENDLILADYHAALTAPDGSIREELFQDGAHPTEAGYARMREVLHEALGRARARLDEKTRER